MIKRYMEHFGRNYGWYFAIGIILSFCVYELLHDDTDWNFKDGLGVYCYDNESHVQWIDNYLENAVEEGRGNYAFTGVNCAAHNIGE